MSWSHAGFNRRHVIGLGGHGGISRAHRACCCGAHRRKIAHALLTGYACSGRVCHDPTDPRKARPSRSLDDAARILQHRGISSVCDQRPLIFMDLAQVAAGAAALFVDDRFTNFVQGNAPRLHPQFDNLGITAGVQGHRLNS